MNSPAISVVISTHFRPELLRESIRAIIDQDYEGVIETVVVFDKEEPDQSLVSTDPDRPVKVIANQRTPGLPGSRNTGVDVANAPIVGFCDDDDLWLPSKARLQMELMVRTGAPTVGAAIEIASESQTTPRKVTGSAVRYEDLIRSRVPEAYMSTVLVRRDAFLDEIGPVDEAIPGGFAEDYDWWLRAARHAPIPLVVEPQFSLRWQAASYFRDKWRNMSDALGYLVDEYPEFRGDAKGYARIQAQRAYALGALGERGPALRLWFESLRKNPLEQRLPFALLVILGVDANKVMAMLNRFGRGI